MVAPLPLGWTDYKKVPVLKEMSHRRTYKKLPRLLLPNVPLGQFPIDSPVVCFLHGKQLAAEAVEEGNFEPSRHNVAVPDMRGLKYKCGMKSTRLD